MSTQIEKVRAHLEAGKTITPVHAMAVYGISRLSSVVEDLRNTGVEIDMVMKRDEMGKLYGEYQLRKPITQGSKVQVKPGWGIGLPSWVLKNKLSEVVGVNQDAALVRFTRGGSVATHWVNTRELVNAS